MFLDRRSFGIGSAALLSGCATVGTKPRAFAGCSPLVPVKVDASRIIRTVAGLRPYRRSGFVVRREQLGNKALVHNYGHGGSGITMSWGTSKLATELGLQGHAGPVAVIGSGPAGLAAAQQLRRKGHTVVVFERSTRVGGLLRYGIPDFKLEKWVLDQRIRQLAAEGIVFRTGVEAGVDVTVDELRAEFHAPGTECT